MTQLLVARLSPKPSQSAQKLKALPGMLAFVVLSSKWQKPLI